MAKERAAALSWFSLSRRLLPPFNSRDATPENRYSPFLLGLELITSLKCRSEALLYGWIVNEIYYLNLTAFNGFTFL